MSTARAWRGRSAAVGPNARYHDAKDAGFGARDDSRVIDTWG
ncbi:hypothetical protein [Caballeronia sp. INDeC2]|nr:hypothetical protein [Caballeronia sp. INDeC2]